MQQENDDLKRFIFQHFGVNLTPKPRPSKSADAAPSMVALPVVLNGTSEVQVVPVSTGQPLLVKVVPAQSSAAVTAEGGKSVTKKSP